jgi:hypothetical protein
MLRLQRLAPLLQPRLFSRCFAAEAVASNASLPASSLPPVSRIRNVAIIAHGEG